MSETTKLTQWGFIAVDAKGVWGRGTIEPEAWQDAKNYVKDYAHLKSLKYIPATWGLLPCRPSANGAGRFRM